MESTDATSSENVLEEYSTPAPIIEPEVTPADNISNMEDTKMVESTVPVLPVTIPATGGYGGRLGCEGLQGKDAAFIAALSNEVGHRDNIRDVLENRFQAERAARDIQATQERLERENQKVLAELQQLTKDEAEKTRNLIDKHETDRKLAECADIKLQLQLLKQKTSNTVSI